MISNISTQIKHPITWFIAKVIVLYIACDMLLAYWLNESSIAYWVSWSATNSAIWILDLLGYTVRGYNKVFGINIDGKACVFVANACNGLDFMGVFIAFVIAYPAPFKSKLWFVPIGLLAIHTLNIVRITLLALNKKHFEDSFDFNHKYTFIIAVYGLIFWLWTYWIQHYGIEKKPA
jgi:exosortase family protein XrtF